MKRTKTLSFKLSLIFIGGMAFAMIAGGITTYFVQSNIVNNYTNTRLKNSVHAVADAADHALIRAETSVEDGKQVVASYFTNSTQLNDETYINESLDKISKVYDLQSKQYEDVCAYYVVLNPAYTHCTKESLNGDGFFYVKQSDGSFKNEGATNILKFEKTQTEHVGWWYPAYEAKKSLWVEPYFNANIGKNMFSYVAPFIAENGDFLGVIGVDIDLNLIIKNFSEFKDYSDAYSILLNKDGTIVYHKDVETFINGEYKPTEKTVNDVLDIDNFNESAEVPITYRFGGHKRTAMSV